MPVRVVCPSCATQLNVKDELAGRAVKCPKCGAVIPPTQAAAPPAPAAPPPVRPQPPAFEEVDEPAGPPKPRTRPVADVDEDDADAPRRPRRPRDEDDDRRRPDRPRPRRRDGDDDADRPAKKSNLRLILGIVAGVLLLCCGGVGFGVYWFVAKVKEKAQEVAGQLEKWNPAVTLANFQRIDINMTRTQVGGILGPAKPMTADELIQALGGPSRFEAEIWGPKARENKVVVWRNDDDLILVCFYPDTGPNGKVQAKAWLPKGQIGAERDGELNDKAYLERYGKTVPGGSGPDLSGPAVPVSAVDFGTAFQDDAAAADAKYKDKVLVIDGKLNDLTQNALQVVAVLDGPPAPAGRVVGTLVQCQFKNASAKNLWSLSRGQPVKILGKYLGGDKSSVTVTDCKLESSGPDPAVQVTAAALTQEVAKDAAAADEKYKGKAITLTFATVESKQDAALILVGGAAKKAVTVKIKATWPFDSRGQLDPVKAGDRFKTVKGEYAGSSDGTIFLNRCWLVP